MTKRRPECILPKHLLDVLGILPKTTRHYAAKKVILI
jgi:hypothetical protein